MNDREILDRLWEAHRRTPFDSLMMRRKLDLRHNAVRTVLNLINDMADSGEVRSGYRIKRVASTMYKLIPQAQGDSDTAKGLPQTKGDSDSLKGKPLIDEKESLTGEPESDCLSTDGGNGKNSVSEQTDPFPDARGSLVNLQNMNIGCLLLPLRSGIPVFRTAQDKAGFDENRLRRWEYLRDATPRDIIQYADTGRVFVPGQLSSAVRHSGSGTRRQLGRERR